MFVSLPPWAVARNVGWPEQARLAARVGYKGIDWPFGAVRTAGVEATRALLAELKIVPTIVNLPMRDPLGPDEGAFDAQMQRLDEDAAFCQAIGCSRFQFVLGPTTLNGQPRRNGGRSCSAGCRLSRPCSRPEMRMGLEFLGPLVFRMARPRPAGAPADSAPPPPPVPFVWTLRDTSSLPRPRGRTSA
jgi:hypothetical protein